MNSTERDLPEDKLREIAALAPNSFGGGSVVTPSSLLIEAADALASARKRMAALEQDLISSAIARANSDNALASIRAERDAAVEALKPFAAIGNDMFIDPENGWSDTDVLSIEADPDYGVFAHLKAGDFRAARAIAGEPKNDA